MKRSIFLVLVVGVIGWKATNAKRGTVDDFNLPSAGPLLPTKLKAQTLAPRPWPAPGFSEIIKMRDPATGKMHKVRVFVEDRGDHEFIGIEELPPLHIRLWRWIKSATYYTLAFAWVVFALGGICWVIPYAFIFYPFKDAVSLGLIWLGSNMIIFLVVQWILRRSKRG